jgi:predicted small integral membrane protein
MQFIKRLFCMMLSVIPLLIGFLAFANNISNYDVLFTNVVKPLMTMDKVSNLAAKTFRAIDNDLLIHIACNLMMIAELSIGILTTVGLIKMGKNFYQSPEVFNQGKQWVMNACILGELIWGLGFFTMGGDYFLSWLNPNLSDFQSGALNYVILMFIIYTLLKFQDT